MAEVKSEALRKAYANSSVEDRRKLYAKWAATYDEQTQNEFGWVGFKPAADIFARYVTDKSARVIDAGCGTGLSGCALAEQGFKNIDGIDLSPEMLVVAQETGVYANLREADLTKPVETDGLYDGLFSVGVFGFGPPYVEHLPLLIDLVQPESFVVLTVNGKGWAETDWETELPKVIAKNGLKLLETIEVPYLEKEQINGKVLVFQR
ncbi:MAG: methyltransferase domain-containing protein [Pseudomonadota bacterium]